MGSSRDKKYASTRLDWFEGPRQGEGKLPLPGIRCLVLEVEMTGNLRGCCLRFSNHWEEVPLEEGEL